MTWRWSSASIRLRLTIWYAGALALMLVVYATATYLAVRHEFREQFDTQLHEDLQAAERLFIRLPDGRMDSPSAGHDDPVGDALVYDAWSVNGEQLYSSTPSVMLPPALAVPSGTHGRYESIEVNGKPWRTLTAMARAGERAVVMRVARSEEGLRGQMSEILAVLVLGLPLIVALAGFGGYVLARRALAPIDHLAEEARRITADRLHARVSVPNQHDEIGRLAAVMNDAFRRLEQSFDRLRRFTADASHELRTPLAVIRGIGESALAEPRAAPDYREAMGSMLEEVDRMSSLTDTLLRLSHADAGSVRLVCEPLDLGELARDVVSSLGILADERAQRLIVEAPAPAIVSADRLVLREALTNIVDNAIKYSPAGSRIDVAVRVDGADAVIAVADEGPGITPEHRERIFDRFFRVDEARSRELGGAGLGLAIAKWAVETSGGRVSVGDRPGGGSEFRIVLPLEGTNRRSS